MHHGIAESGQNVRLVHRLAASLFMQRKIGPIFITQTVQPMQRTVYTQACFVTVQHAQMADLFPDFLDRVFDCGG